MTLSIDAAMARFAPQLPLAVALSGGADSTALLLACARRWPGQVCAVHINHGLQAAASAFERHCQTLCAALQLPLQVVAVQAQAAKGESPEDAARKARYKAFDALALVDTARGAIKSIAFAHNADDQMETVLLALSRGSGLAGLSAMPAHWLRGDTPCYRPLLEVSAADIRSWLQAQGQPWVEDPSNADMRFTRNRIRLSIVPALRAAFPHAAEAFARSARHAAQAQTLLDTLAQQDLAPWLQDSALPDGLPIQGLRQLSTERQANVLRYWLKARYGAMPSAAQLDQLQHQLAACTTRGHRIHIRLASGSALRQGRLLTWSGVSAPVPPAQSA